MRFFHGSGQFDQILLDGIKSDSGYKTDFDDSGMLTSLGGVYMTDRLDVASFYAAKAILSECSLGMDPCVFVLEIDHETLIADEDKIWSAIQNDYTFANLGFDDGDEAELIAKFDENQKKHENIFKRIMSDLQIEDTEDNFESFIKGVRAFVLRAYSWEWSEENNGQEFASINRLCELAKSTISHDWMSAHFSEYAITCRCLELVSPDPNACGNRIVGAICLRMNSDGLKIEGVEAYGNVTKRDVSEFVANFKSRVKEITGTRVTGKPDKVDIKEYTFDDNLLSL